jgi:hypothetical protein
LAGNVQNKHLVLIVGALLTAGGALALTPIGTITSSSTFELSGSAVTIEGVSSWPLVPGQNVVAGASSLTIVFRDGSRITLAPGSRLDTDSGGSAVNLTGGAMQFSLVSSSSIKIRNGGVPVGERSGSASRSGLSPSGGTFRPALAKLPAPPKPISSR